MWPLAHTGRMRGRVGQTGHPSGPTAAPTTIRAQKKSSLAHFRQHFLAFTLVVPMFTLHYLRALPLMKSDKDA